MDLGLFLSDGDGSDEQPMKYNMINKNKRFMGINLLKCKKIKKNSETN
jgi:hypothetical protein